MKSEKLVVNKSNKYLQIFYKFDYRFRILRIIFVQFCFNNNLMIIFSHYLKPFGQCTFH